MLQTRPYLLQSLKCRELALFLLYDSAWMVRQRLGKVRNTPRNLEDGPIPRGVRRAFRRQQIPGMQFNQASFDLLPEWPWDRVRLGRWMQVFRNLTVGFCRFCKTMLPFFFAKLWFSPRDAQRDTPSDEVAQEETSS